ncbi:MAG: YhdH/YhfP family quinone oxidoreductase [Proteobacteria bacterium]|nr:YhdH/YhfP family quinone oxidoreductase [Pseudomonadota bacterium]MBU1713172.1 YhdH/YhfP family quinone oxidoreductase [Pseudomonadota bacterium]
MENRIFKALVVEEADKNLFIRKIKDNTIGSLPPGDIIVRVKYSSLNYKDALSATGNKSVTRTYPHTPGIDAAGVVEGSSEGGFIPGEQVIVTSYDLGMNTSGGFGQYIRVPAGWVVKLPSGLTLKESMILGTAGFTAGMSVERLTASVKPEHGMILVTGATGGVGSIAVAILSKLGYSVAAVSGKTDAEGLLKKLGAGEIISRKEFTENSNRPILKARWAGAIDTVGGEILATAIKSTGPLGVVTCCGNVASPELPINVFPFILRGVSLIGIDSQNCPMPLRKKIWAKLADIWKPGMFEDLYEEISLGELDNKIAAILKGQIKGRTLVNLDM